MRLLLDTHIALWLTYDSRKLSPAMRELVESSENTCFASAASVWEIAVKHAIRRRSGDLAIEVSGSEALSNFQSVGLAILPITGAHAAMVDSLPRHHRDPFDRLLVAQALAEPLRLVTADKALAIYGEIVILV